MLTDVIVGEGVGRVGVGVVPHVEEQVGLGVLVVAGDPEEDLAHAGAGVTKAEGFLGEVDEQDGRDRLR